MSLSRNEIVEYALRYCGDEEIVNFPMAREPFCMFERDIPSTPAAAPDKTARGEQGRRVVKDDEGWRFAGYHIALEYLLDDQAKPIGKWVFFTFISLSTFPPSLQTVKLQPPHIARGIFQNADRTAEFRILKIDMDSIVARKGAPPGEDREQLDTGKILRFPRK